MPESLGEQLKLQQSLNKLIKEQIGLLQQSSRLMGQQADHAQKMCKAMDCAAPMADLNTQTQKATEGLKDAADQADRTSESMGGLRKTNKVTIKSFKDLLEYVEKNSVAFGAAMGAARGFIGGLKMGYGMIKGFTKGLFGLVETFMKLGQTILSIPFKIMTGLIKMSQRGGIDPLRQAMEKLRGEFGSLATNEGKMFVDSVKQMRKGARNLAGTGLSLSRVFGYGREGLAKMLEYNAEVAKAMGLAFGNLGDEWAENAEAMAMYRKGLGYTAEQQAVMLKVSNAAGKSIKETMDEFASMAIQMGEKFGINAKVVGKAMGEMKADVSSFGHMSVKQLGATAVYATKLGIEIKDLMAVFDKFDNFENAAKGAAELSQAFGMNVDTMAMLKAESPAQSVDILRKSFFDAGNTLETMNRHQRKLLEQSSGLKGVALEQAFANKNMGMSYKDIEAGAAGAEKKQLTQAESMQKLSKSIEKLVRSGEHGFNSFFDAFTKGFSKGILRSRDFRKIMRNLQRSLRVVYRAGIRVGRMFVKIFPGVKDLTKGLSDLFNPSRFKILARKLIGVFKGFFLDLKNRPKEAVQNLLDSLTKTFTSHFGASGGALGRIAKGFKTFIKAMSGIVAGLIPIIKKNLAEGLESLVDLIVNPPSSAMAGAAKGAQGFVMSIFGPIWEAIADNPALNKKIWGSIETLFSMLWEKIKASTWVQKATDYFIMIVVGKILLGSLINIFGGAILGKLASVIAGGMTNMFGAGIDKASPAILAKIGSLEAQITGLQTQVAASGGPATAANAAGPSIMGFMKLLGALLAALAVVVVIYKAANLKPMDAVGIGVMLAALAASMALMTPPLLKLQATPLSPTVMYQVALMGGIMAALGLVGALISRVISSFEAPSPGAVLAWGAIMMTMIVTSLPLIAIAYIMSNMTAQMVQATAGMPILGGFMLATAVIGGVVTGLLSAFAGENADKVGALMEGIASILWATLGMIPAAIAIGWAFAGPAAPFAAGGAALAVVGFAALSVLVGAMVGTLMPTVISLAKIRIPDPKAFSAVSGALNDIMKATVAFVEAAGGILGDLKPWPWETDTLKSNMEGFGEMVKIMMASGITDTIDNMIKLAENANIKKGSGPLIAAIGGVLSGIAALLTSLSPSDEVMKTIRVAVYQSETRGVSVMEKATTHIVTMIPILLGKDGEGGLFKAVGSFITGLSKSLAGHDFSKAGPLLSAIGPIFGSVASLMSALSPSDGAFKAVNVASNKWGAKEVKLMEEINSHMRLMMPQVVILIETIGTEMGLLIDKLAPMIQTISAMKIKPKTLAAVGDIIGGVMGGFGAFMTSLAPLVQSAGQNTSDPRRDRASLEMTRNLTNIGIFAETMMDTFKDSMPSIEIMIGHIIKIAKGITNPRKVKKQVAVIGEIFNVIGSMQTAFSDSAMLEGTAGADKKNVGAAVMKLGDNMAMVSYTLLGDDGPLQQFINNIAALKKPKGVSSWKYLKKKTKGIAGTFEGIGSLMSTLGTMSNTDINLEKLGGIGPEGTGVLSALEITLTSLDSVFARSPHLTNPKKAAAIAKSIQTMKGALSGPMAETVEAVTAFAGGKLHVSHSIPKTEILVTVNIDAATLGKKIGHVNIGVDHAAGKAGLVAALGSPSNLIGKAPPS